MSRDHRKLQVFDIADELVIRIYLETRSFPDDERYGLISQMRRAAVSVVANIVEGAARESGPDFLRFLNMSFGSLRELGYYIDLSSRLGMMHQESAKELDAHYNHAARLLSGLIRSIKQAERANP